MFYRLLDMKKPTGTSVKIFFIDIRFRVLRLDLFEWLRLGEEAPNYGSPVAHVIFNLLLGAIFLLLGLLGAYLLSFLFFLFAVPSIYFFYAAKGWARGGILIDILRSHMKSAPHW